jgi:hypothetical protein
MSNPQTGGSPVSSVTAPSIYVGVLLNLWLFLFPIFVFVAQPKEFFLDVLKKLDP